ncbi:MAG: DNA polymerase I [Alphaproteobacteria bacterium]|nr:DNA polymerase I [Alphaproteobacteria bacterium]
MNKKYILVDGSGFIFRAFYALPPISRSDNLPVGAVYGFCNMLLKLLIERDGKDEIVAVIFDAARKNFRNDIYPEYKANRSETPEELIPQFAYIRKAVEAFNLPSIEQLGFEADDLIATYAHQIEENGDTAVIYSSDKDLMQLLTDKVSIFDPLKQKEVNKQTVLDKFGIEPNKVVDVQALIGDSTDNIPGVKGIGPKTAAELINKYGSLESLLENARNIKQDKRRETIETNTELAKISKQLATLKKDVPLATPLDTLKKTPVDAEKLLSFINEMEFKSLISKANKFIEEVSKTPVSTTDTTNEPTIINKPVIKNVEKHYELVRDIETLQKWIKKCEEAKRFAVDTETTGLDSLSASIVGMSIATDEGEACYIPIHHIKKVFDGTDLFNDGQDTLVENQIPVTELIKLIKPLLENPEVVKIGHNIKYDMHIFKQLGIDVYPVEDTMVMSYDLDSTKNLHNMDDLALNHLNYSTIHFADVCGSGKAQITFAEAPLEKALDYAAEDADITLRLYNIFKERLDADKELSKIYYDMDLPLVYILFSMEEWGIKIDSQTLSDLSIEFEKILSGLEGEIFAITGVSFNILSPKQLGEMLFDTMGLPYPAKKKSTDGYSTDIDVLKQLSYQGYEIADKVLKYREIAKLKGTYTDTLPKQILPRDGRVHTNYFECGTSTGRLSSNNPNLQNIPIRTDLGKDIRKTFIASNGFKLLSADYSQIELRVMADFADVKNLKQAFLDNVDIHTRTASQVFGIPETELDSDTRRKAKAINFGIIYGISSFGLANQLNISQGEAKAYIDNYFKNFPEIQKYMEETKDFAHQNGYIKTAMGRKSFIANINNPRLKAYAERAAINAPIQGTAADILKMAMIKIQNTLREQNLTDDIRMLLQVHDELVFEVRDDKIEYASKLIKDTMENIVKLSVPLVVEIGIAQNWKDAH